MAGFWRGPPALSSRDVTQNEFPRWISEEPHAPLLFVDHGVVSSALEVTHVADVVSMSVGLGMGVRSQRMPRFADLLDCAREGTLGGFSRGSQFLPATYGFAAGAAAPKEIGLRWESRGSPIDSAGLCSRADSHTPVAPKSANDVYIRACAGRVTPSQRRI